MYWKRVGGGGLAGPPLLLWSPMVPAKSGEIFLKLKSSCTEGAEENFEPVSLKHWKGGGGGGRDALEGKAPQRQPEVRVDGRL